MEDAVMKTDDLSQSETEDVMDFYRRQTRYARNFCGFFKESELMSCFQRELYPDLRQLLRPFQKSFFGPNALADFAKHAAAISALYSALPVKPKPIRTKFLFVKEG
eukprot:IDg11647t1